MKRLSAAAAALMSLSVPMLARAAVNACGRASKGPCQTPDAFDYFPDPAGRGLVLTNFGLLFPPDPAARWEVVCDDTFGRPPPDRVRVSSDGELFAASGSGLFVSGADGCSFTVVGGELAGRSVIDVAFDPEDRQVVWALSTAPSVLWRSTDRGRTFMKAHSFPEGVDFFRVALAPSDRRRVYLFGAGSGGATPFAWSTDGGQSFATADLAAVASPPPAAPFVFFAIAPDDPQALYLVELTAAGDELWRSSDGGQTMSRLFKLQGRDAFGGLAFGPTSRTLYLAGTDAFPLRGEPPGRLHVSRDGGASWEDPVPSGQRGPRYGCLVSSGRKLYACGAGQLDDFLVGVSEDEGRTWVPIAGLDQVTGVKSCVRARCLSTETWLCDNYGQCPAGVVPSDAGAPPPRDAAAAGCPGPACPGAGDGCGCRAPGSRGSEGPSAWWSLVIAIAIAVAIRARRPFSNRSRPSACWQSRSRPPG